LCAKTVSGKWFFYGFPYIAQIRVKIFMIKYARLNLPLNIELLQYETEKMMDRNEWSPHLNQKHYTGTWNVLSLRSPGGSSKNIAADLMNEFDFIDTPLMQQFSSVQELVGNLRCPVMSVRLLNLKAGAIIKPHRDLDLCFEKGEARIHVPVFTNPDVEFILEEERLLMNEGESWYINVNLVHSACNHGMTDRIHLVIDCRVNEWLKDIFEQGEKALIEEKVNLDEIQKIIYELRLQNTKISNRLADELLEKIRHNATPINNFRNAVEWALF
jgi:hypothetical protein